MKDTPIIFLDEAAASADPENERSHRLEAGVSQASKRGTVSMNRPSFRVASSCVFRSKPDLRSNLKSA